MLYSLFDIVDMRFDVASLVQDGPQTDTCKGSAFNVSDRTYRWVAEKTRTLSIYLAD
jgi:hypothetical protein